MANVKPYKTVFLDWDKTLATSQFWGGWKMGEKSQIYQKIQLDFFGGYGEFIARWMRGDETAESCAELVAQITGQRVQTIFNALKQSCESMTFVSEEIPKLIARLQDQGSQVVIATDNMDTFSRWTVPALNLDSLVDGVLDSYTLKACKRDLTAGGQSAFFSQYLAENRIHPGESVLLTIPRMFN